MDFIPLARPDIQDSDIRSMVDVVMSGMLVQGKHVELLETSISTYIGVPHVAALSNGTATLHTALVALGIGPGDEVIVPAFSYIATANVVELVGATTVFCDVEAHSFNIDVAKIEELINSKTKAIIPVHEFGLACNMEEIMAIARKHSLYVIEDAACALGAMQNKKYVGSFGDYASFSLHPRKAITSGEGGLLVSMNQEAIDKVKILRNHGIQVIDGKMEFVVPGFNYRMTDFQAALVNSQLSRLPQTLKYKNELAEIYLNEIKNPNIVLPVVPSGHTHTWQTFHVIVKNGNRDLAIQTLNKAGIGCNYGAQCIPAMKYYQHKYKHNCAALFPNALNAFEQGIALPLYERLKPEQIKFISGEINKLNLVK